MNKKKILMLLTNPFYPDPRPLKEANFLIDYGHDVKILAWNREEKLLPEFDNISGIEIERICQKCEYSGGLKSLYRFLLFYIKLAIKIKKQRSIDIIYCHDFDTILPALFASKKKHKIVLDSHEQYEGLFTRNSRLKDKILYSIVILLKRLTYQFVNLFVYVDPIQVGMDEKIINKTIRNQIVIRNLPSEIILRSINDDLSDNNINICYYGNIRELEILAKISDNVERSNDLQMYVAGMGKDANSIELKFSDMIRCHFLGTFTMSDLPRLYQNQDLVVCLYRIDESNKLSFPVKFYEAYVLGIPVVTFSGTVLGDFISKNNIGFVLDSFEQIEKFIKLELTKERINKYKKNIIELHKTITYSFESQKDLFLDAIELL